MLVGTFVDEDDEVWKLYLLFRDIVDICSAPRFSSQTLIDLELSLQCLFNEFAVIFPNRKIIPKMHYLLLYPVFMKKVGPLINLTSMRFESKHKQLKGYVTRQTNYKNVPYTISTRHQIELASKLSVSDLFSSEPKSMCAARDVVVEALSVFQNYCSCPTTSEFLTKVKSINIDGIEYSTGCFVCIAVSDDGAPAVLTVDSIYLDTTSSESFFFGTVIQCERYSEHFHAWFFESSMSEREGFCKQSDLVYPHSLHFCTPFGSFDTFIAFRCSIEPSLSCVVFKPPDH